MKAILGMQNRVFGPAKLAGYSILSASIRSTRIDLTATSSCKSTDRPRQLTTAGDQSPVGAKRITELLGDNNWQSSQLPSEREGRHWLRFARK
jgi:hypothetical protein